MVKSFKEYYGGSIRVGGADSVVPMADLGDGPPKGQGGRDMRGVGLHASSGIKYLIYQTGKGVGKTARIVMKNLKDIQTARDWIKKNGHSFDHKGKNFRIYQYKGNPNNIRPDDLIEDFAPVGQQKVSNLIFTGQASAVLEKDQLLNLWIPISSTMFRRIFPTMVRARIFHVTESDNFEQLYRIQNSKSTIAGFQQMDARGIRSGIASGGGVCVELEGNALLSSANDLGSIPVVDGRRFVGYDFFFDSFNKPHIPGMSKDLEKLIKTLIDKYADPNINKKRTSPYFTDYEVFKSIKATHTWSKGEGGQVAKDAGKKMFDCIKDYFDGIESILSKYQKQVQEVLTGYLRRRNTNRDWDEIIVDDFNILKVFIVKDHEENHIFKKDQLDHEEFKKELQFTRLPVEIKTSDEIQKYVAQVSKVEKAKALKEEKYDVDYEKKYTKGKIANLGNNQYRVLDVEADNERDAINKAIKIADTAKIGRITPRDIVKVSKPYGEEVELGELRVTSTTTKKLKMYYKKFKDAVTPKEKSILSNIMRELEKRGIPLTAQYEQLEERKLNMMDLDTVERYADRLFAKVGLDVEFTKHFIDRVNDARNGKQITTAELVRLFKQSFSKHKQSFKNLDKGVQAVLNDTKTDINMPFVIKVDNHGDLEMVAKTVMRKKNFSTSNKKYTFEKYDSDKTFRGKGTPQQRLQLLKLTTKALKTFPGSPKQKEIQKDINALRKKMGMKFKEDVKRIPRKPGQKAGSDKHSDLYTDENPKGTIHGLGFTDEKKAKESVNKIKSSGKTHAHKIQAAIAMSQRAKVASERAKDPEKKKDLGQAHKVYQNFIDTNKKDK